MQSQGQNRSTAFRPKETQLLMWWKSHTSIKRNLISCGLFVAASHDRSGFSAGVMAYSLIVLVQCSVWSRESSPPSLATQTQAPYASLASDSRLSEGRNRRVSMDLPYGTFSGASSRSNARITSARAPSERLMCLASFAIVSAR
eukprot:6180038-Pleurochrysis_carterae.AAC.1